MNEVIHIGIAAGMIKEARHLDATLLDTVSHVTFGSYTLEAREGNPEPNHWFDQATNRMLNAIGLRNQGFQQFLEHELPLLGPLFEGCECHLRVSLAPTAEGHLAEMVRSIKRSQARMIDVLEINAACPNHRSGDTHHPVLAHDPVAVERLMQEAEGYPGLRALKIAPLMKVDTLEQIVELCDSYGFDEIVSGNTLLVEAVIEGKQVLSVPKGGMSGRPLFPMAVEQAVSLSEIIERRGRKLRIIGCGGIVDVEAALDMSPFVDELQVATLFWNNGPRAVADLVTRANLAL